MIISSAFWFLDNYVIINRGTGMPVQSDFNLCESIHACNVFNQHEIENKRLPVYVIMPIVDRGVRS